MNTKSSRLHPRLVLPLALAYWGPTACGGHVYDPDVDGQSHWWTLCEEDTECGVGLSCVCGSCTKACDDGSGCGSGDMRGVCVAPPAWCAAPVSAACAATCARATDCPAGSRCDDAVCVPIPPSPSNSGASNANTEGAESALEASCGSNDCADDAGERTARDAGTVELTSNDAAQSSCGDGIVQPESSEECDDANAARRDGCSPTCTLDSSYPCDSDTGVCFSECGDGVLSPNEACDDGNGGGADGCSSVCTLEPGYECVVPGAPCVDRTRP